MSQDIRKSNAFWEERNVASEEARMTAYGVSLMSLTADKGITNANPKTEAFLNKIRAKQNEV